MSILSARPLARLMFGVMVVAATGTGVFFVTKHFSGNEAITAQPPPVATVAADALASSLKADQLKPRFAGERLGVFISSSEAQWPAAFRRDRSCEVAVSKRASAIDFPRAFLLDSKWAPRDPEAPMPQIFACGADVTTLTYEYASSAGGIPATLGVVRTVDKALAVDVAADRVSTTTISGRDVILLSPITPDGTGQTSEVVVPEPFGFTDIYAFSISEKELLSIAASVIAAD